MHGKSGRRGAKESEDQETEKWPTTPSRAMPPGRSVGPSPIPERAAAGLLGGTNVLSIAAGTAWPTGRPRSGLANGAFRNRMLTLAVLATGALPPATLYVPGMQRNFKTEALTGPELLMCVVLSSIVFPAVEGEKLLVRRGLLYRDRGASHR